MKLAIIDYGAGNIKSIEFAFNRLGVTPVLTNDIETLQSADKIIFPGVGEAGSAMQKLKQTGIDKIIPELKQPVLGICLGMQLLCNHTEEGDTKGLGIFDVDVKRFPTSVKVPQIGWNTIENLSTDLFNTVKQGSFMYLVHSFYVPECKQTIATSTYDLSYSTALHCDNFYGVQFHPEKSSKDGAKVLNNFLNL